MKKYLSHLYKFRYFILYLARCDLIARFRRSKLGMLWAVLYPLMITVIMAVAFGTVFRMEWKAYASYIMAGIVSWGFFTSCAVDNGGTYISASPYIRQFNHPPTLYSLKAALVSMANFLLALTGFVVWAAILNPLHLLLGLAALILALPLFFLLGWAISTIAAFVNAKYRDYPQMMGLFVQAMFYVSPIFFQESMFQANRWLFLWFRLNPVTHLLHLIRKPFLDGIFPSLADYGVAFVMIAFFGVIAFRLNKRNAKSIIFYL